MVATSRSSVTHSLGLWVSLIALAGCGTGTSGPSGTGATVPPPVQPPTGQQTSTPPVVSVSSLDLGSVVVGTVGTAKTVTVSSQGIPSLTTSVRPANSFVATLGSTCVKSASACLVSVAFRPSKEGVLTGSLVIGDTITGLTSTVQLTGVGLAPTPPKSIAPVATPGSLSFSNTGIGLASSAQTVSIVSQNGDPIVAQTQPSNSFRMTHGSTCEQGSQSCQIAVTFNPSKVGTVTGSLILKDTVTDLSVTVALIGVGYSVPPPATAPLLSPTSLDFGTEQIGLTTTAQNVTAIAQNQDALTAQVQPSDSYNLTQGASCAQGLQSCQIAITFSPSKPETIVGSLVITDTVSGLTSTTALTGAGFNKPDPMAGMEFYLPFTDSNGTTVADVTGNGHTGVISGSGAIAQWVGSVGLQLNDQIVTIPQISGRPVHGVCAYFPAGTNTGFSLYPYLFSPPVGSNSGQAFVSSYVSSDQGHGALANFPAIGYSSYSWHTASLDGFAGIHCIEDIVGTSTSNPDHIIVDGKEVTYLAQSHSEDQLTAVQLPMPMTVQSNINGTMANHPVIYSIWGSSTADTVLQAQTRTKAEISRLTSLGVPVTVPVSTATDSTCSITGSSIDVGYGASHDPTTLLALSFPCTIHNFAVSGQPSKDMAGAFQDREEMVYHPKAARNAYNGGPTNSVTNYREKPQNAYQDIVDWNTKAHALGYKTIVSTMISRCGTTGYQGLPADALKQTFNALILANADLFDWVANQAAAPQIGADGACTNATYFWDAATTGIHPNDAGQAYYVAAMRAGFEGIYQTSSTSVSGAYTQIPSDTNLVASGSLPYSITLMDANTANFNRKGTLCVNNVGSGTVTLSPVNGQGIDGNPSLRIAPGDTSCIRATVIDPIAAGASWTVVPMIQ